MKIRGRISLALSFYLFIYDPIVGEHLGKDKRQFHFNIELEGDVRRLIQNISWDVLKQVARKKSWQVIPKFTFWKV